MKVEGQKDGVREEEGQMDEGREVSFFLESRVKEEMKVKGEIEVNKEGNKMEVEGMRRWKR